MEGNPLVQPQDLPSPSLIISRKHSHVPPVGDEAELMPPLRSLSDIAMNQLLELLGKKSAHAKRSPQELLEQLQARLPPTLAARLASERRLCQKCSRPFFGEFPVRKVEWRCGDPFDADARHVPVLLETCGDCCKAPLGANASNSSKKKHHHQVAPVNVDR